MVAVVEDDGIDKGAAADGAHEVRVVVGDVIDKTKVDWWVEGRGASLFLLG